MEIGGAMVWLYRAFVIWAWFSIALVFFNLWFVEHVQPSFQPIAPKNYNEMSDVN